MVIKILLALNIIFAFTLYGLVQTTFVIHKHKKRYKELLHTTRKRFYSVMNQENVRLTQLKQIKFIVENMIENQPDEIGGTFKIHF
jgi:hypothetical protein